VDSKYVWIRRDKNSGMKERIKNRSLAFSTS